MNQAHDTVRGPDALAALRAATATRHERLDSSLPLSGARPGLNDYAAHLRMVRDWLAPLEGWLADYTDGPQAALPAVERLGPIALDLLEPGMPALREPAAVHAWPAGASSAYRWGVCYVIEGSQLGGTVLYGRLADRLAPHPLRYLRGAEGGPGARWRAFMLALKAEVRTPEETAEACAGACAAFDSIIALGLASEQTDS
ncbi:biliverdin-producing heme oxygenase [Massilia sp. ST3]|uniref:biliverdin-producing heme oxygenase n=1 Tax=Massilia sp. ST3 TaxID=2824903 RepID=UPI001B81B8F3|nr:biliverdin-producing heme oxygenase [Massilia sp. ST3]MBQ5946376.1 biliverdin-producing heme oxygenase [Massilia sp. ST3]